LSLLNMDCAVDPSKAQNVLKYHPVFSVDEGVQLAVKESLEEVSIFYHFKS
jgi:nucleoside-diphosphate-sugar epimerase